MSNGKSGAGGRNSSQRNIEDGEISETPPGTPQPSSTKRTRSPTSENDSGRRGTSSKRTSPQQHPTKSSRDSRDPPSPRRGQTSSTTRPKAPGKLPTKPTSPSKPNPAAESRPKPQGESGKGKNVPLRSSLVTSTAINFLKKRQQGQLPSSPRDDAHGKRVAGRDKRSTTTAGSSSNHPPVGEKTPIEPPITPAAHSGGSPRSDGTANGSSRSRPSKRLAQQLKTPSKSIAQASSSAETGRIMMPGNMEFIPYVTVPPGDSDFLEPEHFEQALRIWKSTVSRKGIALNRYPPTDIDDMDATDIEAIVYGLRAKAIRPDGVTENMEPALYVAKKATASLAEFQRISYLQFREWTFHVPASAVVKSWHVRGGKKEDNPVFSISKSIRRLVDKRDAFKKAFDEWLADNPGKILYFNKVGAASWKEEYGAHLVERASTKIIQKQGADNCLDAALVHATAVIHGRKKGEDLKKFLRNDRFAASGLKDTGKYCNDKNLPIRLSKLKDADRQLFDSNPIKYVVENTTDCFLIVTPGSVGHAIVVDCVNRMVWDPVANYAMRLSLNLLELCTEWKYGRTTLGHDSLSIRVVRSYLN